MQIKFILRSMSKNKVFTGINILGLTVGIAAVLLIYRVVSYELSFNKNFQHYDRIVRVVATSNDDGTGQNYSVCVPVPAGEMLTTDIPQFEKKSRVKETWNTLTVANPNGGAPLKKFNISDDHTAFFAESDFCEMFDLKWLSGDATASLSEPNTIVLTRNWATKCFGNWEDAIGKTLLIDNIYPVTVKGVFEELPSNCDFNFPFLISYATLKGKENYFYVGDGDWDSCSSNNQVYAQLSDPNQKAAAEAAVAKVGEKEYVNKKTGQRLRWHHLQPLSELHFDERYNNSGTHVIPKSRLQLLSAIGLLILILACFNFINLATAQASLRAKEVGVRKTLGSGRGQLVRQFMSETGFVVAIAMLLGVGLANLTAPLLSYVSDVPKSLPFLSNPMVWAFLGVTGIVVTVLAGLYPSLTLAGFQPVKALRSNAEKSLTGGAGLRKSLVVMQFVIAQCLIIGAIVTILQLDYIRTSDLGFKKDLVYTFGFGSDSLSIGRQAVLRHALQQIPNVQSASLSSDQPSSTNTWSSNFRFANRPEDEPYSTTLKFADENYEATYGIKMLAGRWLAAADTMREAIINHTMLTKLGLHDPNEAIGQIFHLWGSRDLRIVGVSDDFHTHSLRHEHMPLVITNDKQFLWEAGVKIRPDNLAATTAAIKAAFDEVMPEQVFEGKFLDEKIAAFYEDDRRLSATCKGFGLLAVLISCLGLFGLATHSAQQRVKEIGVRKVLGATTSGIVALLSKDFLLLVVLSLLIAAPLTYWLMGKWLQNFEFHVKMQWWVFVLTGVLALTVAFLTVSFQSIKAALANPVKSLRSE
ncbi:MAG: FtsX-like permease family protein [Bacteroidetes bacterium]|nr:FtsX-like permease family protein [Bacteroidota bacterium]